MIVITKESECARNALKERLYALEKMKRQSEAFLEKAPQGRLEHSSSNGCNQYYQILSDRKRVYIPTSNQQMIRALAQKEYERKFLKSLNKEIQNITKTLELLKCSEIDKIYSKINDAKKAYVEPRVLSDEEYIRNWLSEEYSGKAFDDDIMEIITDRGERVRSKSEKIIADKLNLLGVPYKYECPLKLNRKITIYPDFTLLNMSTRNEVYLEHLGMMDDKEYCQKAVWKIAQYEKNGIYLGENLIATFETSTQTLNMSVFERMLKSKGLVL